MATLAEKYRPKSFDQVVGQDKAIAILHRLDLSGRGIYITGKSGTGKTTIAKIVAKKIAGSAWGIVELTGRELTLLKLTDWFFSVKHKPLYGTGYALIVNESHGLSKPVIEKMLDVLESLPAHAVIIFTTTYEGNDLFEEHLDYSPFQSRCLNLNLARRDIKKPMAERLKQIAQKENLDGKPIVEYEKLLTKCNNNMREAINHIEQGEML